jgi:phosphonate transport system substrate-binding protein
MKRSIRFLIIILTLILSGCGPAGPPPINLNNLELLPTPSGPETPPLRVAIAAVISPQGALESYTPLLHYLESKLGRPVERIQGSTYAETNEVLQSGLVDIAFVCTGAYIKGSAEFGMEILAVPEMDGESVYYSWVIVPANSSAQEIEDLRGSTFAFTDPLSLTGWMYPNYLLLQRGQRSEAFFSQTFFTYSHDRAIHAVAEGFAEGAAIDSLIFNYLIEREPSIADQVRVIHRSPAFGMPPVVVNPRIEPELRAELQELLLNMPGDPDGLAALEALGVDRFVLTEDDLYKSAREVEAKLLLLPTVSP